MEKKTDFQIDAVEAVRRIRDAQHEALAGQTWEDRAAFFRDRADKLSDALQKEGKLAARKL